MAGRRLPHRCVGEKFHLGEQERELCREVAAVLTEPPAGRSIAAWQELFRSVDHFGELLDPDACAEYEALLIEHGEKLAALWNLTTRDELGGRRPLELYLRAILLQPISDLEDRDLDEDWGTKHIQCAHTYEVMDPSLFTPEFLTFVESGLPPLPGTRARWERNKKR